MDLGREIMDKQLLDNQRRRCGKVDDILLVALPGELPAVSGILAQNGTLAQDIGPRVLRLARWLFRIIGVDAREPVTIDWNVVEKIDVVVHLMQTRAELGLDRLQTALGDGLIAKIPGA